MPDIAMQGSLFSASPASEGFDRSFHSIERIELGSGAWIDRQTGWASDPDELFVNVLEKLEWHEGVERIRGMEVPRPRLVASFGGEQPPTGLDVIGDMSTALSSRYGVRLERITCNLYRDGKDSVAWHGDRIARNLDQADSGDSLPRRSEGLSHPPERWGSQHGLARRPW